MFHHKFIPQSQGGIDDIEFTVFQGKKFRCSVIEESEKYYPVIIVVCPGINNKKTQRCCRYIDLEHINNDVSTGLLFDSSNSIKIPFSNDRLVDLLDIAGYVSAAEIKLLQAGNNDFQSCSTHRAFHFHIKVRDYKFWDQSDVQDSLAQALYIISSGNDYKFTFYKAGPGFTPGTIDGNGFKQSSPCNLKITLFSGGLDSLAGAIDLLETTRDNVLLISHQPGQPGISSAQTNLYNELEKAYPGRCTHIKFAAVLLTGFLPAVPVEQYPFFLVLLLLHMPLLIDSIIFICMQTEFIQ